MSLSKHKLNFLIGVIKIKKIKLCFISIEKKIIYILNSQESFKVINGDVVLIKYYKGNFKKFNFIIIKILKRSTYIVIGTFYKKHRLFFVVPKDERILHEILIVSYNVSTLKNGELVLVNILQQPNYKSQPIGKIFSTLEKHKKNSLKIVLSILKFNLPINILKKIKKYPKFKQKNRKINIFKKNKLNNIPFITIDDKKAFDFDDAIYSEFITIIKNKITKSVNRLIIAISGINQYIHSKHILNFNSIIKGNSIYYDKKVFNMFQKLFSNDVCSIKPFLNRIAMLCDLNIINNESDSEKILSYQFYNSIIHSRASITYKNTYNFLIKMGSINDDFKKNILFQIQKLYFLSKKLFKKYLSFEVINFGLIEINISYNNENYLKKIIQGFGNYTNHIVEKFMLYANRCSANFLSRNHHVSIYRINKQPNIYNLDSLQFFLKLKNLSFKFKRNIFLKNYTFTFCKLKKVFDFELLKIIFLKSMRTAIYSPYNIGHFNLNYFSYTHFTSPIRRYSDFITNKSINALLDKKIYKTDFFNFFSNLNFLFESCKNHDYKILETICIILSECERRYDQMQYNINNLIKCLFVKKYLKKSFFGSILSINSKYIFIKLNISNITGLLHISQLFLKSSYKKDKIEIYKKNTDLCYTITSKLKICIKNVNLIDDYLNLNVK